MDGRGIGTAYKTQNSPTYGVLTRQFGVSMLTTLVLVVATIGGMWHFANTEVASFVTWLYTGAFGAPFTGLVVFGVVLTAGRYYGLKSIAEENLVVAAVMVSVVAVAYAAFGGSILSHYAASLWTGALAITFGFVTLYTAAVAGVVYSTDRSFEAWGAYAGYFMIGGVVGVLAYTFVAWAPLMYVAFALIVIGFLIDLVYEIWHTSNRDRSALANGFAVYIAFMGVFVHLLQLVLEVMAADG